MSDNTIDRIFGLLGLVLVAVFVLGLAEGISSGFAGFWGGLPFWVISIAVLGMIAYDYWSACFRDRK